MTLTLYFKDGTGAVVCADLCSVRKLGNEIRFASHAEPLVEQTWSLDEIKDMDWSCQDVKPSK